MPKMQARPKNVNSLPKNSFKILKLKAFTTCQDEEHGDKIRNLKILKF